MDGEKEKTPHNKTTVTVMVVMMVLFAIGILVRWDYIKKEVVESFRNRFPNEEIEVIVSDTVQ